MTIPELIDSVLGAIRNQFYMDRVRDFKRDERALTKAVARYGYECAQRGWEFSVNDILRDLLQLLNEIKRTGADIKYFPVYLEGAVTRHVGIRSEELQAKAKQFTRKAPDLVKGLNAVKAVVRPDNTEILAAVYGDLKRISRSRRAAKKVKAAPALTPEPEPAREVQEALL